MARILAARHMSAGSSTVVFTLLGGAGLLDMRVLYAGYRVDTLP
jgi:hypothetical protein